MVPRGYSRTGTTPDGKPGKTWTAKYATLGTNALGMPILIDGLNERGLSVGLFYFRRLRSINLTPRATPTRPSRRWELGSYILENFATVNEVRANLPNVVVPDVVLEVWKSLRQSLCGARCDRQEHCHRVHRRQTQHLRQSAGRHDQLSGLRLANDQSEQLCEPFSDGLAACSGRERQAPAVRPRLGDAGTARRLHAAVTVCARCGFQSVGAALQTGYEAILEALDPNDFDIPKGETAGATKTSTATWLPIHDLDQRQRSEGQAVLFPFL